MFYDFFKNHFTFVQLVKLGIHVGHSFVNSTFFSSWMLYGFRTGICLINLLKFVNMFRIGFYALHSVIARSRSIWFVNKDKTFDRFVRFFATKCGEFSSTFFWIRGMVSNYRHISFTRRLFFSLSSLAKGRKKILMDTNFKNWLFTRYTWPGMVFVSSVYHNYFVVNEASSACVPCLGIVDSNASAQGCNVAIPGNDDSLDCIIFYHDLLAGYILYRKFVLIYLWYMHIRRQKRLVSFYDWLTIRKKSKASLSLDFGFVFSNYLVNRYALSKLSLKLFFCHGLWLEHLSDQISVYRSHNFSNVKFLLMHFENSQDKYFHFFSFFFFRHAFRLRSRHLILRRWSRNRKRRRRVLRNRLSTFSLIRKSSLWEVFKFRNFFKYIWKFHSIRRHPWGSRGSLFRFIHFYFFMYVFYFKSIGYFRDSFLFYRRKFLRKSRKFVLRDEFKWYRWCAGRIFRRHKFLSLFSRFRPKRRYGSFISLRFILFSFIWKVHNARVRELMRRRKRRSFVKRYYKGRSLFFLPLRKWAFLYKRCLAYILLRRSVQKKWLKCFGVASKNFDRHRAKYSFILRRHSGKFFYSFASFFRRLKQELMRFFLYGFFKPLCLKLSFFNMRALHSKALFQHRIFLARRRRNRRKLRHKRRLFKSKAIYHFPQKSLLFKGLPSKFSIGFFSFETKAAVSNYGAAAYDFFLASPFPQFLNNRRLRYRFFGNEIFYLKLLRYRVFLLNPRLRRLALGLRASKKNSRLFKVYRHLKRWIAKAPRLMHWHLHKISF